MEATEEIVFPKEDVEYIRDVLENCYNLSMTMDIQDRVKKLGATLVKSKLTRTIELSLERIEKELKDEPE